MLYWSTLKLRKAEVFVTLYAERTCKGHAIPVQVKNKKKRKAASCPSQSAPTKKGASQVAPSKKGPSQAALSQTGPSQARRGKKTARGVAGMGKKKNAEGGAGEGKKNNARPNHAG